MAAPKYVETMSSKSTSRHSTCLLDLPQSTIFLIAQFLPCCDLPSLLCCCKDMASLAPSLYSNLISLDMRCFPSISPSLCLQLIQKFSDSCLQICVFRFDTIANSLQYDDSLLQSIITHFLDNYRCDNELLSDLHGNSPPDSSEWFSLDVSPRPIYILAHCYLLDKLLSSQPALKELYLDFEFGIFKVPKSRGYRQTWHLMQPFLALQSIQKKCPRLQRYMANKVCYQNSTVHQQHLQVRFLENCHELKFVGITFGLDTKSLESYEQIRGPLALEKADFLLEKWHCLPKECLLNHNRMRSLAEKMQNLKSVVVMFKVRGCLKHCREFLLHLACVQSLCLRCDFNSGFPNFDIDEGMQSSGRFFDTMWSLIRPTVRKISLLNVPEEEFELLFGEDGRLPSTVKELSVQFVWRSAKLEQDREEMLAGFLQRSPHLLVSRIEGYCQGALIFSKTNLMPVRHTA